MNMKHGVMNGGGACESCWSMMCYGGMHELTVVGLEV